MCAVLAKYDGRCPGCEIDIFEGVTEIVKDGGEWVCVDCVDPGPADTRIVRDETAIAPGSARGDDALARYADGHTYDERAQTGEPPRKRVAKRPDKGHTDLHADRYDRYTLIDPSGKPVTVSRASTVIKALADTYSLNQWKQACVLRGAARRPDLSTLADSLDTNDYRGKAKLRSLVKEAEEAGGSKTAANLGTAVHTFCEGLDTNKPGALAAVPPAHRKDVAAYVAALYRAGVSIVPDMVERTTMTTEWGGVGGTFDNIFRLPDGRHVIGDKKTGKVGYDPPEMYGQFAVYQAGVQENGVYDRADADGRYPGTWTRPDFDVDRDEAIIVHIPVGAGRCTLYAADLTLGRLHLDRCARIRAERREKHNLNQYVNPDFRPDQGTTRADLARALTAAASKAEAAMVWAVVDACGLVDEDMAALAKEVADGLNSLS